MGYLASYWGWSGPTRTKSPKALMASSKWIMARPPLGNLLTGNKPAPPAQISVRGGNKRRKCASVGTTSREGYEKMNVSATTSALHSAAASCKLFEEISAPIGGKANKKTGNAGLGVDLEGGLRH